MNGLPSGEAYAIIGMHERNWRSILLSVGQGGDVQPLLANRLQRIALSPEEKTNALGRTPSSVGQCPAAGPRAEDYLPDLVEIVLRHFQAPFELRFEKDRAPPSGVSE